MSINLIPKPDVFIRVDSIISFILIKYIEFEIKEN